jgi:hypothetical protein
MPDRKESQPKIPLTEKLKSIPEVVGISFNEEPKYETIEQDGPFSIRRYEKTLIARVTVEGPHKDAVPQGFKKLAAFIFGENESHTTFAMTAPVLQEDGSEKLPMTSPVLQESRGTAWTISFIMPEKFTKENLPQPTDASIELTELPERTVAVFKYSGTNDEEKMLHAKSELEKKLKEFSLDAISDVKWAQYDPPFTIPLLKTNEALVEVSFAH